MIIEKELSLEDKKKIFVKGYPILTVNDVNEEIIFQYFPKEKLLAEFLCNSGTNNIFQIYTNVDPDFLRQENMYLFDKKCLHWIDWIESEQVCKNIDVSKKKCKCNILEYIQYGCKHVRP